MSLNLLTGLNMNDITSLGGTANLPHLSSEYRNKGKRKQISPSSVQIRFRGINVRIHL